MGGLVPASYLVSLYIFLHFIVYLSLQELSDLMEKEAKRMHKAHSPIFFIGGQRLQQLLNDTGMTDRMDRVEVEQAVQFLHECGTLLHYDDIQSNLSDMYFLNPEWLCGMMAQIISVRELTFIWNGVSKWVSE